MADVVRAEALDEDGSTLRVWETDELLAVTPSRVRAHEQQPSLLEFARILAESCDRAALRQAEVFRTAFEQQAVLVNALSGRLAAVEKAWHTLLMSQRAEEQDPNGSLVSALLAGAGPALMQAAQNGAKQQ